AIGVEAAVHVDVLPERVADGAVIEEDRAERAATLNKAQYLPVLAERGVLRAAGLSRAGNKRFVRLNDLAGTAHRAGAGAVSHRQPDPVHQEPRGFHAAAKGPLHLAGAAAFLRRADQIDRLKPYPQRNMTRPEAG